MLLSVIEGSNHTFFMYEGFRVSLNRDYMDEVPGWEFEIEHEALCISGTGENTAAALWDLGQEFEFLWDHLVVNDPKMPLTPQAEARAQILRDAVKEVIDL